MNILVKKITGEEFITTTDKKITDIFNDLCDTQNKSFILFGDRIEQKMTIESVSVEKQGE